jgi:uncharacterized protein YegP (UPF0339 family)
LEILFFNPVFCRAIRKNLYLTQLNYRVFLRWNAQHPKSPWDFQRQNFSDMKFEIYESESGKYYFRLKASNGQVILSSQGYTTKANAINGTASVAKNAVSKDNFEVKTAADGSPFFNLLSAANGQVIGSSEMYSSKAAMENGIESVMRTAPNAEVVDLTL